MKTRVVTITATLALLLPAPVFAAGACAALTKTPEYQSAKGLEKPENYGSQERLLRKNLMGKECDVEEIHLMMEGLGWLFQSDVTVKSAQPTDTYERSVSFCDKRRGIFSRVFNQRCRGRAVVGLRGDSITFLVIHGGI